VEISRASNPAVHVPCLEVRSTGWVAWPVNHHSACPNRPAAAVPSVDFRVFGLPASGNFGRRPRSGGCRYEGMQRDRLGVHTSEMTIEILPIVGNLVG
jgi:hypothetical protein